MIRFGFWYDIHFEWTNAHFYVGASWKVLPVLFMYWRPVNGLRFLLALWSDYFSLWHIAHSYSHISIFLTTNIFFILKKACYNNTIITLCFKYSSFVKYNYILRNISCLKYINRVKYINSGKYICFVKYIYRVMNINCLKYINSVNYIYDIKFIHHVRALMISLFTH